MSNLLGKKRQKKTRYNRTRKIWDVGVTTQAKHLKIKPKEWWNSSVVDGKYKYNLPNSSPKKNTKSSVMKFETSHCWNSKKTGKKSPSRSEKIALLQELQQLQARLKQRPGHDGCEKAENGDFYTSWESSVVLLHEFFGFIHDEHIV